MGSISARSLRLPRQNKPAPSHVFEQGALAAAEENGAEAYRAERPFCTPRKKETPIPLRKP